MCFSFRFSFLCVLCCFWQLEIAAILLGDDSDRNVSSDDSTSYAVSTKEVADGVVPSEAALNSCRDRTSTLEHKIKQLEDENRVLLQAAAALGQPMSDIGPRGLNVTKAFAARSPFVDVDKRLQALTDDGKTNGPPVMWYHLAGSVLALVLYTMPGWFFSQEHSDLVSDEDIDKYSSAAWLVEDAFINHHSPHFLSKEGTAAARRALFGLMGLDTRYFRAIVIFFFSVVIRAPYLVCGERLPVSLDLRQAC